jgi:hypothetical protein
LEVLTMRDMLRDVMAELLPVLLPIAAAAIAELLRRLLRVQQDSEAGRAINAAVERAGNRVYEIMAAQGVPLSDQSAINRITAQAAMEAGGRVSNALGRRGVGETEFRAMVRGEFARAVAADPNITIPPTKE